MVADSEKSATGFYLLSCLVCDSCTGWRVTPCCAPFLRPLLTTVGVTPSHAYTGWGGQYSSLLIPTSEDA
eukprot:1313175-Rhodomonas_salina.1